METVTLNKSDIKFCATTEDGNTLGFAFTADNENNSVNFYMLNMETWENHESGTFEFGDQAVDLQQRIEMLVAGFKLQFGQSLSIIQ